MTGRCEWLFVLGIVVHPYSIGFVNVTLDLRKCIGLYRILNPFLIHSKK